MHIQLHLLLNTFCECNFVRCCPYLCLPHTATSGEEGENPVFKARRMVSFIPPMSIPHPAWLMPDSEEHNLTYSFGGQRTLIKRSLWHCGVKALLPPEELGVATPEELPGTWCRTCEREWVTSLDIDGGEIQE